MSLFKKFTDFCAGVAAFIGGLFIIQKYMAFEPKGDEEYIQWITKNPDYSPEYVSTVTEAPGKLSQFTTPALAKNVDYRPLILLVLLFVVTIIISRVLKKYPYVCFGASLLPAILVAYLTLQGTLHTQPGLFIVFSLLFVIGNLVECMLQDKADGGHRLWIASRISMAVPAFACLCFGLIPMIISRDDVNKDLIAFPELVFGVSDTVLEILIVAGIMFSALLLITSLLFNVYFVDAVLSAVPLGYLIFVLYGEKFTVFTSMLLTCAVICFTTCLLLCIGENNLSKKEQAPKTESPTEDAPQELSKITVAEQDLNNEPLETNDAEQSVDYNPLETNDAEQNVDDEPLETNDAEQDANEPLENVESLSEVSAE